MSWSKNSLNNFYERSKSFKQNLSSNLNLTDKNASSSFGLINEKHRSRHRDISATKLPVLQTNHSYTPSNQYLSTSYSLGKHNEAVERSLTTNSSLTSQASKISSSFTFL